jgi:transcriptional regulator with XRE-family HTH domain
MHITSEQLRAARALLRWEQKQLAEAAGVPLPTLKRIEAKPGPVSAHAKTLAALQSAAERAGIVFFNGGEPGVKFRKVEA